MNPDPSEGSGLIALICGISLICFVFVFPILGWLR